MWTLIRAAAMPKPCNHGSPCSCHSNSPTPGLIREDAEVVYGDAGYPGIEKREEVAQSVCLSYRINRRRSSIQKAPDNFSDWEKQNERRKSLTRSKGEHPFLITKRFFGYSKTVYRGLAKNTHHLHVLFTSANLLMCSRASPSFLCLRDSYSLF